MGSRPDPVGFFGGQLFNFLIGHEALHNAGLTHSNSRPEYKYGDIGENLRYQAIEDPEKRQIHPDYVMSEVYP